MAKDQNRYCGLLRGPRELKSQYVTFPTAQNYCENFKVHRIEGMREERMEVTGGRGRRRKQLLYYLKDMKEYCKLKEKAHVYRTVCRSRCHAPAVWQTKGRNSEVIQIHKCGRRPLVRHS